MRYDRREGDDGGDGPWFVCVFLCVWKDHKKYGSEQNHACILELLRCANISDAVFLATRHLRSKILLVWNVLAADENNSVNQPSMN